VVSFARGLISTLRGAHDLIVGDYMHTKFNGMYNVSIGLLKIHIYVHRIASTQSSVMNRNKIYLFSKDFRTSLGLTPPLTKLVQTKVSFSAGKATGI